MNLSKSQKNNLGSETYIKENSVMKYHVIGYKINMIGTISWKDLSLLVVEYDQSDMSNIHVVIFRRMGI